MALYISCSLMKKAALISACESLIKKFDPKKVTLDSHAAEELGDCESPDADPNSVFIKQVFYGCVRNKTALKVSNMSSLSVPLNLSAPSPTSLKYAVSSSGIHVAVLQ